MHTRHTTPTSEARGRKIPAPPPSPHATFVMIENRATCKSKRQRQRGRADRLRFMLTQVKGHWARSRAQLKERVDEGCLGRLYCVR